MVEEISGMIQAMAEKVKEEFNSKVQKALFEGLEQVGIAIYFEDHNQGLHLDRKLVVRNMRASNHDTVKISLGIVEHQEKLEGENE